jgi:hypothetical protein
VKEGKDLAGKWACARPKWAVRRDAGFDGQFILFRYSFQ